MTNFDFLLSEPRFASFAQVAVSAENLLHIDCAASALNCRRALEFAIKWMYSVDRELIPGEDERLKTLMANEDFRQIVGRDILECMERIRDLGNAAAHEENTISKEDAARCIEDLFRVMDFIAYCYADSYEQKKFDPKLLEFTVEEALSYVSEDKLYLSALIEENRDISDELTKNRMKHRASYTPKGR